MKNKKNNKSTTEYYRDYYKQNQHIYKYHYYNKKLQDETKQEFFKDWGGERAYYELKYKEFMALKE